MRRWQQAAEQQACTFGELRVDFEEGRRRQGVLEAALAAASGEAAAAQQQTTDLMAKLGAAEAAAAAANGGLDWEGPRLLAGCLLRWEVEIDHRREVLVICPAGTDVDDRAGFAAGFFSCAMPRGLPLCPDLPERSYLAAGEATSLCSQLAVVEEQRGRALAEIERLVEEAASTAARWALPVGGRAETGRGYTSRCLLAYRWHKQSHINAPGVWPLPALWPGSSLCSACTRWQPCCRVAMQPAVAPPCLPPCSPLPAG